MFEGPRGAAAAGLTVTGPLERRAGAREAADDARGVFAGPLMMVA
jgi:hypothetical protein